MSGLRGGRVLRQGDVAAARGAEAETGSLRREDGGRGWAATVAFHIRTGFADMSQVVPPESPRADNATLDTLDAFLASEAKRVKYPPPVCPDKDFGAATYFERTDGPLRTFLKCVISTAKNLAAKAGDRTKWGTFMLTDSPAVRAAVEREFVELDGVVTTGGAYGHVKFANSGVCVQHGAKQTRATRRTRGPCGRGA